MADKKSNSFQVETDKNGNVTSIRESDPKPTPRSPGGDVILFPADVVSGIIGSILGD